ncbi:minor capsid protein [[Ruminococcus] lactaris]|uniref:minor capsid protein n=1 Tax=[Ruminococcus] lactaris TaxID=46228 RepID=UPI003FD81761
MAKIKTRVTFDRAATIARIKAASNDALTDMGHQALMDASKHVPKDQGTLENSGLSLSDKKAVEGIYTLRWNTPYARYLWHGDVMYGNPTSRTYGPEKLSFTSALAHEEWAKYAKEIYGEEWKVVYQAALKEKMR